MKFDSGTIRRRRLALGMTQAQLADKVGVVVSLVAHWEKGDKVPSTRVLPHLATALELTIDALYGPESPGVPERVSAAS